jgi:hypothetical protein
VEKRTGLPFGSSFASLVAYSSDAITSSTPADAPDNGYPQRSRAVPRSYCVRLQDSEKRLMMD